MVAAAILAIAIFLLPVFVLTPVMDRFINSILCGPSMRAIVRRAFGIDKGATIDELP
jgi:hypothetical protein